MRWLPSLQTKGAVEDATRRATATNYAWAGNPYHSTWNVDRAVKDGYDRVIWVFRAIDHIASAASRLPIVLRVGDENGPPAEGLATKDPLMRLLNRVSNAWEPAAAFRYRLSSQLLLSKKGVFIEVVRSRLGDPIALHLLPCGTTSPIPHPKTFVSGFEVYVNGVAETIPAYEADGVTPHVLWVRKPHPIDPYSGVTPMESAGLSIDMDFYARMYNRGFLQNDGRPGGLLGVKGKMDPDDKAELRRRFGGGPSQAGRTSVINSEELSWVDTAVTPREAQFADILKITKQDVLSAFGVPESILGNSSDRTYANAAAEKLNFWEETMPPHMDLITGSFDYLTQGGIEDDLYLVHDTETVPVLQKAKQEREEALQKLFDSGLISADEFREETGRDPISTKGTRSLWIAGTKKPIGDPDGPEDDIPPATPPVATQAARVTQEAKSVSLEAKTLSSDIAQAVNHRAKAIEKTMVRYFTRQERVVLERLGGVKARRGTQLWDPPGTKAVDAGDLLDTSRWDAELQEDLGTQVQAVYDDEAEEADVEITEAAAATALALRLKNATEINVTTKGKLDKAVAVGDGDTAADVKARVQDVYEEARTNRAVIIGETEAAGATNEARDLIAGVVGSKTKFWRSRGDAVVRDSHKDAHGQKRSVEKPFEVGGASLKYPGDPTAPLRETARCRCWVEYTDEDD